METVKAETGRRQLYYSWPIYLSLFVLMHIIITPNVQAQNYNLSLVEFEPSMDSRGMITIDRGQSMETGQFNLGIYLSHGLNALTQNIDQKDAILVRHYSTGHAIFALGLAGWAELGAQVPLHLVRGDFDGTGDEETVTADGIGDVRASLKLTILRPESYPVSLALILHTRLPTGQKDVFMTNDEVVLKPTLVSDVNLFDRLSIGLNIGFESRSAYQLDTPVTQNGAALARTSPVATGQNLSMSLGLALAAVKNRFHIIVESLNRLSMDDKIDQEQSSTLLVGGKLFLLQNSFFSFGLTKSLAKAPNNSEWQGFLGIIFEPQRDDQDGDGIADDDDQCVAEPEDKDDFEDYDGCPEVDNDRDGIFDFVDACPNEPEDLNNFEDKDGCPDGNRDRDNDGLADRVDQCPEQPEDRDNYRDEDGCPDPDNDMDTIPDVNDQCPLQQEDIDGFEDADGCPDEDNDKDRIPDVNDRCPDQPENYDGVDDEDGCPEERVVVTREKIEFDGKVYFETNRAEIRVDSYELLEAIASVMAKHPELLKVEVQGHSDSRGDDKYNLELSDRRAAAVRAFLIAKGVAPDRLQSKGYGESRPVINEENARAWAQNRRVEFIIIERTGMTLNGVNE